MRVNECRRQMSNDQTTELYNKQSLRKKLVKFYKNNVLYTVKVFKNIYVKSLLINT